MHLGFETKVPGTSMKSAPADMVFHYRDRFGDFVIPDAYERLLMDAIQGDASLFARRDEIEWAWMILDPLIAAMENRAAAPPAPYRAGSWGPDEACTLLEREGYAWQTSCSRE
jgi:glucose-6-phosphate 1-dehydrogenase